MIEGDRKRDSEGEKDREHRPIVDLEQQAREVGQQDKNLSRDDVRHNRADEKTFFAFEDHATGSAAMFEIERALDDQSLAASRTLKFETAPNSQDD